MASDPVSYPRFSMGLFGGSLRVLVFVLLASQLALGQGSNQLPIAAGSTLATDEDTPADGTLTGSDPDGDKVTFHIGKKQAVNGAVVISSDGQFTYTPNPNFHGTDTFGFVARDGHGDSAEAPVTITVRSINDVPEAYSSTVTLPPKRTYFGQLRGSDLDGDPITFSKVSGPTNGTVVAESDGRFTFTPPDPTFKGVVSFTFTVSDGLLTSSPATVTIVVGDRLGFVADTHRSQLTAALFPASDGAAPELFSTTDVGTVVDLAVDRANRRLYALTSLGLHIYEIPADDVSPTPIPVAQVPITGTHLALSLDARTAFVAAKGMVTAVNLYPESIFRDGKSVLAPAYDLADAGRTFRLAPDDREVVAIGVHPAGHRLLVVLDASSRKVNVTNDLLRSDVGNGTRAESLTADDLPDDFGYITQLDISADVQTFGAQSTPRAFLPAVDLKKLIYPNAVAVGIKSIAFSPDGNCAFLAAVGGQTVRATPFGIMPTTDEGTGGIVVLDVRPRMAGDDQSAESWVEYLGFIPTTERDEKTDELRMEIRKEGWRIVHPEVQWARNLYTQGQGLVDVGGSNMFTGPSSFTAFTLGSMILAEMEESFVDYGYMQAYFQLYPRDMVGASGIAVNRLGNFGVVTMQDTNNLGLLSMSPASELAGYTSANRPDFFIQTGTGKTINAFNSAIGGTQSSSTIYSWAYPQEVAFTSDDTRIFIGTAGGTPSADMTNRFGSADALMLRDQMTRADSVFKGGNPPPGYGLYKGDAFQSPRQIAARHSFEGDFDGDRLSDQLEALNRWNSLRNFPGEKKEAMISTSAGRLTDPGAPLPASSHPDDALDQAFFLPSSGIGYRFDAQAQPGRSLNAGSFGAVSAIEQLGRLWHESYLDEKISRPYFIVGVIAAPGGGILKNAADEELQYGTRNGFQVNFPYPSRGLEGELSDSPHDFVLSNDAASPRDNSVENVEGFDSLHAAKLLRLLYEAQRDGKPLASRIEMDPAVRDELLAPTQSAEVKALVSGISFSDARFMYHGVRPPADASLEERQRNHSRRDLDSQFSVSFSTLAVKVAPAPLPTPGPGDPPLVPGRHYFEVILPEHLNRDTMRVVLPPFSNPDDYLVRTASGTLLQPDREYTVDELLDEHGKLVLSVDPVALGDWNLSLEVLSPEVDTVYSLIDHFKYIQWTNENNPRRHLDNCEVGRDEVSDSHRTVVQAETVGFYQPIKYRIDKWVPNPDFEPTGPASLPSLNEDTGEIISGLDEGTLFVFAETKSPDGKIERTPTLEIGVGGCGSCASGACEPIGQAVILVPEHGIGFEIHDGNGGKLRFMRETPGSDLTDPIYLEYPYHNKDTRILRDARGALRQSLTAQVLLDIIPLGDAGFVINSYRRVGKPDYDPALGLYSINGLGSPLTTFRFEPDPEAGENGVRVTYVQDGVTEHYAFLFSPEDNSWTLLEQVDPTTGKALRQRVVAKSTETEEGRTLAVTTRTVTGADGTVALKQIDKVEDSPTGPRLITRVDDPDGANRRIDYAYTGAGLLDRVTYSNGRWERFGYDAQRRVTKRIEPWLSAPISASENECQVTSYDFAPIPGSDDNGTRPNAPRTTIRKIQGVEIARSYDVFSAHSHRRITALRPGVPWNDAGNLVVTTRVIPSGDFAGRVASVLTSEGLMTQYIYEKNTDGGETTITRSGTADASFSKVVAGSEITTVTNRQGHEISSLTVDIVSGLTLNDRRALEIDAHGRPLLWTYLDGSTSSTVYNCCGIDSETDRRGITTTYTRDEFKRMKTQTRLGVTYRYERDAAGRVRKTYRRGTDGSEVLISRIEYADLLDQAADHYDAMGRKTEFRVSHNADGTTTRTTVLPGGFTQWAISGRDGRALEVGGTGVPPKLYEYRIESLDGYPCFITRTIARILDPQTGAYRDSEWSEIWTNMAGQTVREASADGTYSSFYYNEKGQLSRTRDPDGVTLLFEYDAQGERAVTAIDINRNGVIDFAGPDRISRTSSTFARKEWKGRTIGVTRSISEIWPEMNSGTPLTVQIQEKSLDGLHAWTTQFDNVAYQQRTLLSNGAWNVKSSAPNGSSSVDEYENGRLSSSAAFDGAGVQIAKVSYSYDAHGRTKTVTDVRKGTSSYTYYDDDQVKTYRIPHPELENEWNVTTFYYNERGLLDRHLLPDESETFYTYTPQGLPDRVRGSQTYPLDYDYDSQGRMVRLTTWQDFQQDAGKSITAWRYDPQTGRLSDKTYPAVSGQSTQLAYLYTSAGRLQARISPRVVPNMQPATSLTATYGYHSDGILASVNYNDDTPDIQYEYHRHGLIKEVRDGVLIDNKITDANLRYRHGFKFDGELRPEIESLDTVGHYEITRRYEGDLAGEVRGRYRGFDLRKAAAAPAEPSLYAADYNYDSAGRLRQASSFAGTFDYAYLPNSDLVEFVTGPLHTVHTTYQPKGDGTAVRTNSIGSATISRFSHSVNRLGQRMTMATSGMAFVAPAHFVYRYNEKGEVVASDRFQGDNPAAPGAPIPADTFAYDFDDIGNRKTSSVGGGDGAGTTRYNANALNQYDSIQRPNVAASELDFDPDGNLIGDGQWSYTWNGENRLIRMETLLGAAQASGAPLQRLEFSYDYQGRRVRKRIFTMDPIANVWSPVSDVGFIYDGWNLIAEIDIASAALLKTYTWGRDLSGSLGGAGGIGGLLAVTHAPNATSPTARSFFPTYDANGNISEYLDQSGNVVAHFEYGAFGEVIRSSGMDVSPFGFSTKYRDVETGLIYYGFRYYNPNDGRWLNRDPIQEHGGVNLYGFLNNNGVMSVDYNGLCDLSPIIDMLRQAVIDEIEERIIKAALKKSAKTAILKGALFFVDGPFPIGDVISVAWMAADAASLASQVNKFKDYAQTIMKGIESIKSLDGLGGMDPDVECCTGLIRQFSLLVKAGVSNRDLWDAATVKRLITAIRRTLTQCVCKCVNELDPKKWINPDTVGDEYASVPGEELTVEKGSDLRQRHGRFERQESLIEAAAGLKEGDPLYSQRDEILKTGKTPPGYVQAHDESNPAREGYGYSAKNSKLDTVENNKADELNRRAKFRATKKKFGKLYDTLCK